MVKFKTSYYTQSMTHSQCTVNASLSNSVSQSNKINKKALDKRISHYLQSLEIEDKGLYLILIFESSIQVFIDGSYSFTSIGYWISSLVVGIQTAVAMNYYRNRNFYLFYYHLQRATLIAIFVVQFFLFLQDELSAIIWLFMYVLVYMILKSRISRIQTNT